MLSEAQIAALLIKVAASASIASILMRFGRIQRLLLADDRTVKQRVQLAFMLALVFGATAEVRILSHQYQAIELAMEGAIISGLLGGYVTGLITGLCVCVPDMFAHNYMSMPLFAAAGILGGIMRDLAPRTEDVWSFSPFIDLNLYRLVRQVLKRNPKNIERRVVEKAAFNLVCNALVIVAEFLRWGINHIFKVHRTFLILEVKAAGPWDFIWLAATTLFATTLPIRIWSSFRTEKQLEAQRVHLTEARLAALTNQINPHFLFNTLNSIATLIRINPDQARSMIYKLSNILRRLLRKTENFSPLREEVSFIDDYLAIEMVRFGDKLRFHKEIDPETLDLLVPSMVLQPIIENSIRHGLANKVEGGMIRLRTWVEDGRLRILVEDDGLGIEESKLATLFEQGIGVSNVNERLRVLFGPDYRMTVDSLPGHGTHTLIEIPDLASQLVSSPLP
ncbi:MAG TPA: histidine kinase [Bryobacteraceae bacterium]|nr:histidine kinase [Bryobacteraceae bacterium]